MRLNIDSVGYRFKPRGKEIGILVNRLKRASMVVDVPQDDLSILEQALCQGKTITAGEMAGTSEKDWRGQQLFVFDIDNEADALGRLSPEDVKELLAAAGIPIRFGHWTFSSKPRHSKFRVFTVCDEIVTDAKEAKEIIAGIMSLFPTAIELDLMSGREKLVSQVDLACKNLDRMFMGTNLGLIEELRGDGFFGKETALELYRKSIEVQSQSELKESFLLGAAKSKANAREFDLSAAYREFDLLGYILGGGQQRIARTGRGGEEVLLNPCPICGHNDDFWVNIRNNVFKCFSAAGGQSGNINNYLQVKFGIGKDEARDMFKYDILGIDREEEKRAWRDKQYARARAAHRRASGKSEPPPAGEVNTENLDSTNILDTERALDMLPCKFDLDYITIGYDENKTRKHLRKSQYLEAGSPGKVKQEVAEPVRQNLILLMEHYGLSLRYNIFKGRTEVFLYDEPFKRLEDMTSYILDKCKLHRYKVTKDILEGQLVAVSKDSEYNPIKAYLDKCYEVYDGFDYVGLLCKTIESPVPPERVRMYIERFLLQMVWLACSDENDVKHHGEFTLVLQGKQGQGKTSWFRNLLPEFLQKDYFLDSRSMDLTKKDDILEQGTVWLCEMGEIAATFRKTDQEALKAYITAAVDKVRPPYGKEAIEKKRRMCLCATTNDAEFLRDSTGNRRYAVIPCDEIDQFHGIDLTKIYAQVYHRFLQGDDRYYFDQKEIEELFEENRLYRVKSDLELAVGEVFDLFADEGDGSQKNQWLRSSDILDRIRMRGLDTRGFSLRGVTAVLKEIGCRWRINGKAKIVEFWMTPL